MSLSLLITAGVDAASSAAAALGSHPFAAPGALSSSPGGSIIGIGQVTLAMCVVLAAIFACAYVARRLRGGVGRAAAALDVIAEIRLGSKERAVLLQVGRTQVLVGVAPGSVNTLHVLAEPV